MLPYWGRLSLRLARVALALAGAGWAAFAGVHSFPRTGMVLATYVLFSLSMLPDLHYKSSWRFWCGCVADLAYLALWTRLARDNWMSSACLSYVLVSVALQRGVLETAGVALLTIGITPRGAPAGAVAVAAASYQSYLRRRVSVLLGQQVALRAQAQRARETERERIAADFHDGPLQSFVGFQVRLEVVKTLLSRGDGEAAFEEVRQLQDLGRAQVAGLQRFARSMRPADEGLSLQESLRRTIEAFQKDTRIQTSFSARDMAAHEPPARQELLQMVGEALHNISKHSEATRVVVSVARDQRGLEMAIEDNGSGFPFSGSFSLDELDRLRIGPVSIKRRIRLLDGELFLESKPGQGAKLTIRLPV